MLGSFIGVYCFLNCTLHKNLSCAVCVNCEGHISVASVLQMREEVFRFLFF